jgi:hypothetical protein
MKPGQISAKRAYEISDSLMKSSLSPKTSYGIAKAIKDNPNGAGRGMMESMLKNSDANVKKATRLKSAADAAVAKATAGRDTPLPSSEGMMNKITSGLASLFGK